MPDDKLMESTIGPAVPVPALGYPEIGVDRPQTADAAQQRGRGRIGGPQGVPDIDTPPGHPGACGDPKGRLIG
jgi:hypothetical protein